MAGTLRITPTQGVLGVLVVEFDRARLTVQLRRSRTFGWFLCALLGGAAMGGVAWADGGPWALWCGIGVIASGLLAKAHAPHQHPVLEIEPKSDPQGVVRAALSVPENHPHAGRLGREASAFRPRLKERDPRRAFLGWASVSVWLVLWSHQAPNLMETGGAHGSFGAGRVSSEVSSEPYLPVNQEANTPPSVQGAPSRTWFKANPAAPTSDAHYAGDRHGLSPEVVARFRHPPSTSAR
ncbi:MAG: hypothetical protein MK213_05325 [Planctomycetes bacterium]|nr:hypothetical protein [Planctomycetota bacterium]